MFGKDQPIILHLLDIPPCATILSGVVMELDDCALPLLRGVVSSVDVEEGLKDVDYAVLVGAFPRREGMERKDLLEKNCAIFKQQGAALAKVASKNVKVLVVGNPANTNSLIALTSAKGAIPKENFTALTRLDHNRARNQIAKKLGVTIPQVQNVVIWGNHSSTQYPDVSYGFVTDYPNKGDRTSVADAVNDQEWLQGEFIRTVQKRGAAIIDARKLSSAGSAAQAICDHMRNWVLGTSEGEYVSMAVPSDGSYGVPEGIIYSFPVTCKDGSYTIVPNLEVSEFSKEKMVATANELQGERDLAFNFLKE
uniref:Malate dehydrogenase n=1 Tax=Vannella robusta TaxID=1487602 RepID=A0A7S4MAZ8_9EUKA